MSYSELSLDERIIIRVGLLQSQSLRAIARQLNRSPSTISREVRRNRGPDGSYTASLAQQQMKERRQACRPERKLEHDSELFQLVTEMLRDGYSPEQIAGNLRRMFPTHKSNFVSHETIYNAIYALPVGELRKELIHCLRHGKSTRKPRAGGVDRRNQIPDMVSVHVRPPEVEDRLVPGHWEGDLIKGKNNASAVGTLVERTSGYLMLVKMHDATATSAVEGSWKDLCRGWRQKFLRGTLITLSFFREVKISRNWKQLERCPLTLLRLPYRLLISLKPHFSATLLSNGLWKTKSSGAASTPRVSSQFWRRR